MKGYQKLGLFLAVLLFSVGLMSVAIDILGDITDLELDVDTKLEEASTVGTKEGDMSKRKGQSVQVEGTPAGGASALFEVVNPPKTRYLRWSVGETYEGGEWQPLESHEWTQYEGEVIDPSPPEQTIVMEHFFSVRPLFNISGFIPGAIHTTRVGGLSNLERYSYLELFASPKVFSTTYSVSHITYEVPDVALRDAEVTPNEAYLQIPEEIVDNLTKLALEIAEEVPSQWEKLKVLESYLKTSFEYDEDYETAPNDTDPVEWFLFEEGKGVCTQFNSAFVLLARSLGIPTRAVMGFLIKPESNYQIVMARDAHLWVEASFEGIGWVTFDATPEKEVEQPMDVTTYPTITNITYNDPTVLKGDQFRVLGTVNLLNGTGVDGLTVEVFLTLKKNETDAPCGIGIVREGIFEIDCNATPEISVGDYNLIAHTLPSGFYEESWSDPPIRIMTETNLTIQAPVRTYVGRSVAISGTLLDASNGQPIPNATLMFKVGNETLSLMTDGAGSVSMTHTYEAEGNKTIQLIMDATDYHLGSNSSFGIAVSLPPERRPGFLQIITMFPYNMIITAGLAVALGSVLLLTKRRTPRVTQISSADLDYEEEHLTFKDYKEGVVKLFNRFYKKSQRRYEGIVESMTPREFQAVILSRVPQKATSALEYLVTAFEIADYSTAEPSKEIYEKCFAAVELLDGKWENE